MSAVLVTKVLLSEWFRGGVWKRSFHCERCGGETSQSAAFCAACGARFLPGHTEREVRR